MNLWFLNKDSLNEIFEYREGELYWRIDWSNKNKSGSRAGRLCKDGYRRLKMEFQLLCEHHIIWIMHNGPIPDGYEIDHKNEIKHDNNILNLRLATRAQNKQNQGKQSFNTTGLKGVSFHKRTKKFQANITFNNQRKYLGCFDTAEEAYEAYKTAARQFHGEFAKF